MRYLFPILLITALIGLGFYACNRNAKADPSATDPTEAVNPEKEAIRKGVGVSSTSNLSTSGKAGLKKVKHHPVPQPELSPEDKAQLYVIDDFVKMVESERGKAYKKKELKPKLFSENDNMYYTTNDKKVMESIIVSQIGTDDTERHYYYFNNNNYSFYRHLEVYLSNTPPSITETIVFFKDNKIFEVQQRHRDLMAGENPNKLLSQEFTRPDVDKAAMQQEIEDVWAKIFDVIELNEMGGAAEK